MGQLVQGATYLVVYFAAVGCCIDPALRRSRAEPPPRLPSSLQLGHVRVDPGARSIRFPARLNLDRAPLEYLLVTDSGKVHESLLVTSVPPREIHAAMLLLGARGSSSPDGVPWDLSVTQGDSIAIDLEWKRHWARRHWAAQALVHDRAADGPLRVETWSYNGSRTGEGAFMADLEGSIISLITDPDALANSTSPRRGDDENWLAERTVTPPVGTPIWVIIRLLPGRAGTNAPALNR